MLGPVTFIEIGGAFATMCLVIIIFRRSSADTKKENVAFTASTGAILTIMISVRFIWMPTFEEDLRIQGLASSKAESAELFHTLGKSPATFKHPLMTYIFRIRLASLDEYYDNAINGRAVIDQAELPEFLMQMIRSARRSISASSYAQPASWWDQPWGKEYEKENEEAVKRGVSINRTFLFASSAELDNIRLLLQKEKQAGINVKYVFVSNLHSDLVNGLVCIDDTFAGELHMTPQKGIKEAEFFTDANSITNIQGRIARIQSQAIPIDQ